MLNTVLGSLSSGVAASTSSFESIASATGTGASGVITFSSIPQTYAHLQIRINGRSDVTSTSESVLARANGDTGSNYVRHNLQGDGTTATAGAAAPAGTNMIVFRITGATTTANAMGTGILDIHDYTSTTKYKTFRSMAGWDGNGTGLIVLNSGLWLSTSAITSISILTTASNFTTATTVSLYGIKGA